VPQRLRFETGVACTSTARVLLRIVAAMIAPCSVKTYGKYLRRWPRPVFKLAICHLKELVSSAFTVAVHLLLEALRAHPTLRTDLGLHDVIGRSLILRLSLTGPKAELQRTRVVARKQPFAVCDNLRPWSASGGAAQGVHEYHWVWQQRFNPNCSIAR
jgi:hypothetical protein